MIRTPRIFILNAILCTFFICVLGHPALSADISVGTVTAFPGEQAVVTVSLENNDIDITSLTVPLKFSSSDILVDSISFAGTLLKINMSPLVQIDNDSRFVRFTYTPTSGLPVINDQSGILARIFVTVKASAPGQVVYIDSVNHFEYAGPPQIWTRPEIADSSGLGDGLYLPAFFQGSLFVESPSDADDDRPGLPHVLELHQNYPNPFNPITKIAFTLPERVDVRLSVYNILGQEMETLVDGSMPPGRHEVIWAANHVASGIYFYRLAFKDKVLTKKMILLK